MTKAAKTSDNRLTGHLVAETLQRLAEIQAAGFPRDQMADFTVLLERALDGAKTLCDRETERDCQLKAARRRRWPRGRTADLDVEGQRVKGELAKMRASNARISKTQAVDPIAAELRIPRSRVRQHLRAEK
jgi:hypothetical protein